MHALTLIQQHQSLPGGGCPLVVFCAAHAGDSPAGRDTDFGRIAQRLS